MKINKDGYLCRYANLAFQDAPPPENACSVLLRCIGTTMKFSVFALLFLAGTIISIGSLWGVGSYLLTLLHGGALSDMQEHEKAWALFGAVFLGALFWGALWDWSERFKIVPVQYKWIAGDRDHEGRKIYYVPNLFFEILSKVQSSKRQSTSFEANGEVYELSYSVHNGSSVVALIFPGSFVFLFMAFFAITFVVFASHRLGEMSLLAAGTSGASDLVNIVAGLAVSVTICSIFFFGHRICQRIEVA